MYDEIVLSLQNISKQYHKDDVFVLSNVSLDVKKGKFMALLGPSGSGKSTLLHISGFLDNPTDGKVIFEGNDIGVLDVDDSKLSNDRTAIRLSKIGFVYQYHHLLQEFSSVENVMLPQLIAGTNRKIAIEKSKMLLTDLGLQDKFNAYPSELSGGQKQRVAIARALANDPVLLLADEPTGNLDHETSMLVFEDLLRIMHNSGMSALIATHNQVLAEKMDERYIIG